MCVRDQRQHPEGGMHVWVLQGIAWLKAGLETHLPRSDYQERGLDFVDLSLHHPDAQNRVSFHIWGRGRATGSKNSLIEIIYFPHPRPSKRPPSRGQAQGNNGHTHLNLQQTRSNKSGSIPPLSATIRTLEPFAGFVTSLTRLHLPSPHHAAATR